MAGELASGLRAKHLAARLSYGPDEVVLHGRDG